MEKCLQPMKQAPKHDYGTHTQKLLNVVRVTTIVLIVVRCTRTDSYMGWVGKAAKLMQWRRKVRYMLSNRFSSYYEELHQTNYNVKNQGQWLQTL